MPSSTSANPTFLVGAERSGTTMLRLMLDHHDALAWANEFEFSVDEMNNPQGWPALSGYLETLSTHRIFQAAGYTVDPALDYPDLVRSFLEQRRTRNGKTHVGATIHRHFDRTLRIWPEARFIHIVRDPRDVAPSCIQMGWAGNVWTGIARWVDAEDTWDRVCAVVPPERRVEVRYEQLIEDPKPDLERICALIGLDYTDAMLTYPEATTYGAPDPRQKEKWRTKLSPREVQWIEARVGDRLSARGYTPSGEPHRPPSAPEALWLGLQDRVGRFRHSVGVYGWRLRLADMLTRRLGLEQAARRVRLRINEIDQQNLK